MNTATVTEYTAQRAELLARLVLTRRKGVRVFPYPEDGGTGIDLIAHLSGGSHDGKLNPHLFVRVKGTSGVFENEQEAAAYCRPHWKPMYAKGFFLAPAVFLLFSMEGDQGYFSWVLEPWVDREKGPSLTWLESPDMTKITKKSIDGVLDAVEKWFDAMSAHLLRDNNAR